MFNALFLVWNCLCGGKKNYLWLRNNNGQYLGVSVQYVAFTLRDVYILEVPQELSFTTVSQKRKAGI